MVASVSQSELPTAITQPEVPKEEKKKRAKKNTKTFNDMWIRRLRPPKSGQELYWDKTQKGLSLLVSAGGTKTFRSQFQLHGKWVSRTVGRFGEVVADDGGENPNVVWARERVREDRRLAKGDKNKNVPPADPREANPEPSKLTFEAVVDQFIEKYAKPRQRTWKHTEQILKTSCRPWLARPITSITKADAFELLDGFIAAGHGPKAGLTLAWLRTLWRWAWQRDIVPSPFMDAVKIEYEKKERDRVYSDDEIRAIWSAASSLEAVEAGYVKTLLLLAPRKTALAHMRLSDLDDLEKPTLWTTPHELTKSKKTAKRKRVYLTPLPPLAQRILKPLLPKPDAEIDLVFPGTHHGLPIWPGSPLQRKLISRGAPKDFSYHAVRHTVATWLENNGHDEFDRGLVLNHAGSGVTAGYSHGHAVNRKREVLEKWAEHVESLVEPARGVRVLR